MCNVDCSTINTSIGRSVRDLGGSRALVNKLCMYTGSVIVTLGPPLCERPIHGYRGKAMAKNGDGELAFFICLAIFWFKSFALNSRISPYYNSK